jgi:type IV pilus assembly protein PilY1
MVCLGMAFAPLRAAADDIDIFAGASAGTAGNPNILIIIDNTVNWSAQSQHWPGGITQGQAELQAMKTVVASLGGGPTVDSPVNVGLMMLASGNGGYVRYAMRPMSVANKVNLQALMQQIYDNYGSEGVASSMNYGDPLFDAFKYFGGYTSPAHATDNVAGTPQDATHFGPMVFDQQQIASADAAGYTSAAQTTFSSVVNDVCARNFIIFIGNGFPKVDNYAWLTGVGGDTTEIAVPNFTTSSANVTADGGYGACSFGTSGSLDGGYSSVCSFGTSGTIDGGYGACSNSNNASTVGNTCPAGTTVAANTGRSKSPNTCSPSTKHQWGVDCTYVSTPSTVGNTCTAGYTAVANTGRSKSPNTCSSPQQKWGVDCTYASNPSTVGNTCATGDTVTANTSRSKTPNVCTSPQQQSGVDCTYAQTMVTPTGTYSAPAKPRAADEWTRFLYQTDVNSVSDRQNITTYTIDVFNSHQDTDETSLLMSMARVGGGKYCAATTQGQIQTCLQNTFSEIQSVNSMFASASLPISATNRAVRDNQVYVGVFRPDPDLKPRWFGNLKQYQLILDPNSGVGLADSSGTLAINPSTGFITNCATSFWTSDSNTYWSAVPVNPLPAGLCTTTAFSKWSDAPDGPFVEKGSVAEVVRKGNNPPTTNLTPTWAVNRTMKTFQSGGLTSLTTTSSGLAQSVVDFTLGKDVNDENANGNVTDTRPSLHGDVIHSRPLAIDYGGTTGVSVFYGANDGTLRAVDSATGKERWALVANEFFSVRATSGGVSPLQRLRDNAPLVSYGTAPLVGSQLRDYLFDGSIGVYQNADSSKVWIYPTMRRGGRTIYGLDVSTPGSPSFKWKVGCPNLTDDTGCSAGTSGMGQTWSMPNTAFLKGYSNTIPIIAVGGGYDTCEDGNTSSPSCSSPKGNHVYIIDADTGTVLRTFDTERSVIADITFVDVDFDGYPDYAYAVDTGGSVYRIDFVDSTRTPLASASWVIHTVAYTTGSGRKFQYAPAALPNKGKVYLAFGSGDREHPLSSQYPFTTPVVNRFYVYLDDLSASPADKAHAVNLDSTSSFGDFTANPSCNAANVLPSSSQKGWYLTLNQHGVGEQTVTSAAIAGGMFTFSTNRAIAVTAGTCTTALGEARGYFVNLFNGSGSIGVTDHCGGDQSATFVGGGLPPSPVLATVLVNGQTKTVLIGAIQKNGGTSSVIGAQTVIPPLNFKRKMMYWFTSGSDSK